MGPYHLTALEVQQAMTRTGRLPPGGAELVAQVPFGARGECVWCVCVQYQYIYIYSYIYNICM